jgi:hypothetical protein
VDGVYDGAAIIRDTRHMHQMQHAQEKHRSENIAHRAKLLQMEARLQLKGIADEVARIQRVYDPESQEFETRMKEMNAARDRAQREVDDPVAAVLALESRKRKR